MGAPYRGSYLGLKRPGHEADDSAPSSAQFGNKWSCTSFTRTSLCRQGLLYIVIILVTLFAVSFLFFLSLFLFYGFRYSLLTRMWKKQTTMEELITGETLRQLKANSVEPKTVLYRTYGFFYFSIIQTQTVQICDALRNWHEDYVTVFGCRKFYMLEFRKKRLRDSNSLIWCVNVFFLTMLLIFFDRFLEKFGIKSSSFNLLAPELFFFNFSTSCI
jgi:hypothetical protein